MALVTPIEPLFDRHFIKRSVAEEALRRTVRAFSPGRAAPEVDPVTAAMKVMCDEEALELASIAAIASPEETEAANESPAATEPPPDEA